MLKKQLMYTKVIYIKTVLIGIHIVLIMRIINSYDLTAGNVS